MDKVAFLVSSEHRPPVGYWSVLDIRVNGVPLHEVVQRHGSGAGSNADYMGLDPAAASTGHFLGQPVVRSMEGRPVPDRVLLRCTCGEPGCDNVTAEVSVDEDQVTWRHFRAGGDPLDIGPFKFDRRQYEAALRLAIHSHAE